MVNEMNENNWLGLCAIILGIAVLVLMIASTKVPIESDNNIPIVGGDRDEHGCIGSAGYSWCDDSNSWIRPWETECGGDSNVSE